jgi:hypothetical protein
MPVMIIDHHLKDFDAWFALFSANPPPQIGNWRLLRGVDDPNRVCVIGDVDASDVGAINSFVQSEQMQTVFSQVNEMSTAPLEFVWLDEPPH